MIHPRPVPDQPHGAGVPSLDLIASVPVRHRGQWAGGAVAILVVLWLGALVVDSGRISISVILDYLFHPVVLRGVLVTIELTVISMLVGLVLGVLAAVAQLSDNVVLRSVASGYVWFFRGTPVLVQLIFWFNIGILFPQLGLIVPFTDIALGTIATNDVVTPMAAAILGLGLNSGAYIAEIVRGGVISVIRGQSDAAHALGMPPGMAMRRIILPQSVPAALPPLGNEFIGMLKYSSMASVIAVKELLGSVEAIYSTNLRTIELLIVASLWYLLLTTLFTLGQRSLERRMGRGRASAADRGRTRSRVSRGARTTGVPGESP